MIFYLLHEYVDRYHRNDFSLGKKFARTAILGFIIYYVLYFIIPLYIPQNLVYRAQHFLRYAIVVDILASSIFYGGMLNSISFWSTGTRLPSSSTQPQPQSMRPKVNSIKETIDNILDESNKLNEDPAKWSSDENETETEDESELN